MAIGSSVLGSATNQAFVRQLLLAADHSRSLLHCAICARIYMKKENYTKHLRKHLEIFLSQDGGGTKVAAKRDSNSNRGQP